MVSRAVTADGRPSLETCSPRDGLAAKRSRSDWRAAALLAGPDADARGMLVVRLASIDRKLPVRGEQGRVTRLERW